MELSLFELIAVASIPSIGLASIFAIAKYKVNSTSRSMKKGNQDAILEHYQTLQTINEDQKVTINQMRGKITQFVKKINELDGMGEPQEDQIHNLMPPELLAPLAQKLNMTSESLTGILESPQAKKFLGSKDNQELIKIVLPLLASKLGSSKSQGSLPQSDLSQTEIA